MAPPPPHISFVLTHSGQGVGHGLEEGVGVVAARSDDLRPGLLKLASGAALVCGHGSAV